MEKDFDTWNKRKKKLHIRAIDTLYFHERDVWWCSIGVNIGFEQDGKGETVQRPVVVLRKFNKHVLLVLPLTTKVKKHRYYFPLTCPDGVKRCAILS